MAASLYKWLVVIIALVTTGFTDSQREFSRPSGNLHPFYVSVTEFNYNSGEKLLEITSKVFLDDLEKALKKHQSLPVELTKPANPKQAEEMVNDYFRKHLLVKLDGKPANLEFVGYEPEGSAIWVYYQVSKINAVRKLGVTNTILYEMFPSQISIMHAQVGSNKKSTRITNPEANADFEF